MFLRHALLLFLILVISACSKGPAPGQGAAAGSQPAATSAPAPISDSGPFANAAVAAANTIDRKLIHDTVAEIASDAYQGRAPGSEGDVKARAWLAARPSPGRYASIGFDAVGVAVGPASTDVIHIPAAF